MQSIGVMISRRLPIETTLPVLAESGVRLVQLWCLFNELDVTAQSQAAAERVLACTKRLGVSISALCADTGKGFVDPDQLPRQMQVLESACRLCQVMNVNVLSSHFGAFGEQDVPVIRDTLRRVGDVCERYGVSFASETGLERGPVLRALLDEVSHPRIRVNLDPANLVRRKIDLRQAVEQLGPYIVHAHAKDGRAGGPEVVIGHGDVPWSSYLYWLSEAGYDGPMLIEREADESWMQDVLEGYRFLRNELAAAR
ncbi:MAG: sugar phosphate isomerase/epimerase [Phycisphaeraceae bacterium]|nr:sugar phosphate isomerase/epimerase [Phycisphaeraceae bacterium]